MRLSEYIYKSVLVVLLAISVLSAQSVSKEERMMQLQMEEAQIRLDQAQSEFTEQEEKYGQMKDLKERGVITGDELNTARKEYEEAEVLYKQAQIDLEKTRLNFLSNASNITVVQAQKYRDPDGRDMVRITLKNTSNLQQARVGSSTGEENLRELLRMKDIRVSLLSNYMMVGDPYEVVIPALEYQQVRNVVFALRQKDLSNIVLQIKYQEEIEERNIYLEKKSAFDIVTIVSQHFSQEGRLGSPVKYDLTLERLAEDENTYTLEVFNLPSQYRYDFWKDEKQVSQIKFPRGTSKLTVDLQVYVPENIDKAELDVSIPFLVAVGHQEKINELRRGKAAPTEDMLKEMRVGSEGLELVPKGVADMELYLGNLYIETKRGDRAEETMNLKNTGTVTLKDVAFESDVQTDWTLETDPKTVKQLQPDGQTTVKLVIIPPPDIEPGKYELTVKAVCEHQNQQVESTEKNVSVIIQSRTNLLGSIILITLLVGMVVGVAVLTIKISRR